MDDINLLPYPKSLKRQDGRLVLPWDFVAVLDPAVPRQVLWPIAERLREACEGAGAKVQVITAPADHPNAFIRTICKARKSTKAEAYTLSVGPKLITIEFADAAGLRAGVATIRQLLREYGRRLPCLVIRDFPDFPRRGVMLDVSRGRVPRIETLLQLVDHLADFKINEFQLYTEHTFAYSKYEPVWRGWGPLTGDDILKLDARCQALGIDLVPNQNSFGHLRYWLEHPPLHDLAEVDQAYEGTGGAFLRYPTTLAPTNPKTIPFIRGLFDELLPHFVSRRFNVGCDETWDLGRGQSKELCESWGKGRVYVEFLKKIQAEVSRHDRQMMFWGDIILHHPELIRELPDNVIALNWGYEANHPFEQETATFARSKVPFYVCPGTSTWMSLIGRHDNAFANLRSAARAGNDNGAAGYLNTDWGDGGHPQPLAVSYAPYLAGAALSWNSDNFEEKSLVKVLSRDIFEDATQKAAQAAVELGLAHRHFNYLAPNVTPFGTVIAAPPPRLRELVCRDGLKYYARIPANNIWAAMEAVEEQRKVLYQSEPRTAAGELLAAELDMAARMSVESCRIMLWQQQVAAGKPGASRLAMTGVRQLQELRRDFFAYWHCRNRGDVKKCAGFLDWRISDYRQGKLHFHPAEARTDCR